MRFRLTLVFCSLIYASSLFAVDRWVLISGTVGVFHTDARVLNPSFDKDIQISATFMPAGNTDNNGAQSIALTVPKRQMRILNDVTTQLFNTAFLGAIRFTSADEFEVTSRIYAITSAGTLGQFGPGLSPGVAKAKGAVLQLKSNGINGQQGTFRTNIGAVNPANAPVTVTWKLYDLNSAVVGTGTTVMPPFAVIGPTGLSSPTFFQTLTGTPDLSDAWISYSTSSDTPIFVYGSVVDNGTTDQTFVPAVDDKGVPPPPPVVNKTFDVRMQNFSITFSPAPSGIKVGDQITLRISNSGSHSFGMFGPNGNRVVSTTVPPPGGTAEKTFTVSQTGEYFYRCENSGCGQGHSDMNGSFIAGAAPPEGTNRGY